MLRPGIPVFLMIAALTAPGATIVGTVTDSSGKPLENVRVDHTGKRVVVTADLTARPSPDEIRTDAGGHFHVVTTVPAIVIRKPGFESQRVRITGDAQVQVTLHGIRSASRCTTFPEMPKFKTKQTNDIDYAATWYYIKTEDGPKGIISGTGPMYTWGAPDDRNVWNAVEYTEIMYESGIVDAAGHSGDGKYWRYRGIFGAAAQYYNQTREIAEQLDCVMDRVPVDLRPFRP